MQKKLVDENVENTSLIGHLIKNSNDDRTEFSLKKLAQITILEAQIRVY